MREINERKNTPIEVPGKLTAKAKIIEQCASRRSYLLRQGLVSWVSKALRRVEQLFCCSFFIFFIAFLKWAILDCIAQGSVFRAPTVSWDLWRRWRMTVARKSTPASVGGYWYCSNSSRPHFHAQRTRLSVGCGTNQLGPFISSLFFLLTATPYSTTICSFLVTSHIIPQPRTSFPFPIRLWLVIPDSAKPGIPLRRTKPLTARVSHTISLVQLENGRVRISKMFGKCPSGP